MKIVKIPQVIQASAVSLSNPDNYFNTVITDHYSMIMVIML